MSRSRSALVSVALVLQLEMVDQFSRRIIGTLWTGFHIRFDVAGCRNDRVETETITHLRHGVTDRALSPVVGGLEEVDLIRVLTRLTDDEPKRFDRDTPLIQVPKQLERCVCERISLVCR